MSAAGSSAFVTGLSGGNLGQILKGTAIAAITAAAFFEVGSITNAVAGVDPSAAHIQRAFGTEAYAFNVAGHALVGCGASVANGGSCGPGALSGAVTAAAGPLINGQRFQARMGGAKRYPSTAIGEDDGFREGLNPSYVLGVPLAPPFSFQWPLYVTFIVYLRRLATYE